MARIRSIKPELRTSLTVAEWPREVRYFWVLLWGYLDDYGRGVDDARLVKADCLPLDDDVTRQTVDRWLDVLATAGPLCRYEVRGRQYIHAPNWLEHQRPQHPKDSVIPPCTRDHSSGDLHEDLMKPSGDLHEDLTPEQVVRAGSREQAAEQPRAAEKSSGERQEPQMRRIVREHTDASEDEAAAIVAKVRERKPKSLGGFLVKLAEDGDLFAMIADMRADAQKAQVAADLASLRAGPSCTHGVRGGEALHPITREPLCPQCRNGARMRGLNETARPAGAA